jgi:hypothetical protein
MGKGSSLRHGNLRHDMGSFDAVDTPRGIQHVMGRRQSPDYVYGAELYRSGWMYAWARS